jgi:hypothetical protein
MWTRRDILILCGRVVIVGIAVLVLALIGRLPSTGLASKHPTPYRSATPLEQLQHDVHQAWEIDQTRKK